MRSLARQQAVVRHTPDLAAAPQAAEKTNNFLIPNGTFFFELIVFVLILIFGAENVFFDNGTL